MLSRIFILVLVPLLLAAPVQVISAEGAHPVTETVPVAKKMYKWVDREGNVTYNDQPPPDQSKYKVEERRLKGDSATTKKPLPSVVLFSVPKCPSCDTARAYLQKRQVLFTEKNVDGNRSLLDELKNKTGGFSVPTILVGEKVLQGYLESLLAGELDSAGYPPVPAEKPAGDAAKPKPSP